MNEWSEISQRAVRTQLPFSASARVACAPAGFAVTLSGHAGEGEADTGEICLPG